jgi:hypothetical protein
MPTEKQILTNLNYFAPLFLKIQDKNGEIIPFNLNSVQSNIYKNLTNRTLILKARQMGVSTLIQAEIFRRLITSSTSALTLSHDEVTTQLLRDIQDRFYTYFPQFSDVITTRTKANDRVTKFNTESRHVIGTAGNTETGRGGTYNIIHGTEVAFWKDAEKILSGAMQGGNPQIILESTPNGVGNYFYDLCMDSLAGRNDWKLIFIPYTEFPEYMIPGWKEIKQLELKELFKQEYPEDVVSCFLHSGNSFFSDIEIDYSAPIVEYNPTHKYTGGIDFGQSNDYTVLVVIDRTIKTMVDSLHINRMSWSAQRKEIKEMYSKWRLSGLRAERNSIGSVNIEELEKEGITVEAFDTTNSSKSKIFQELHESLESGLILQNNPILRSEMNTLTSKQTPTGLWTVSADGKSHDDYPMALALANSARFSLERRARSWN